MLDSRALEVGIGLATVYLFFALLVTQVVELISSALSSRAVHLKKALDTLLDENLRNKLWDSPLIRTLGVRRWLKRADRRPSYIPSEMFARALVDDLPATASARTSDWRELLSHLPEEVRRPLDGLVGGAATTLEEARDRLSRWFDLAMERVSGSYKRHTQVVGIVVGFGLAALLNADTIGLAQRFWLDPALRAAVAQAAETQQLGPCAAEPQGEACRASLEAVRASFPLGWSAAEVRDLEPLDWAAKLFGLLLTALAASLGAPFWFDLIRRVRKPGATRG